MKKFKGKAIYNPSGKAGEYSYWACNFYKGCSNNCSYCYLKKGLLYKTMGGCTPELKKCFKDKQHALEVFEKELKMNLSELQEHGLFFSFTTDPMLPETQQLTLDAAGIAVNNYHIPVKILTKCTDWVDILVDFMDNSNSDNQDKEWRKMFAFGFTLTGHDELEPNASTNRERIIAMRKLHDAGFKTFASIEPIVDFDSSFKMILDSMDCCDLYKIGLMSGYKPVVVELKKFCERVMRVLFLLKTPVYWKESISKYYLVSGEYSVSRDFNLFK